MEPAYPYPLRLVTVTDFPGDPDAVRMRLSEDLFEDLLWRDCRNPRLWEAVERTNYGYNRAVFFPAGRFHSASRFFGSQLEDGRLWQSFHFGVKRAQPGRG